MEQFKKREVKMPDYLAMYEISGQDKITEHSFDRYNKDKELYEEKIRVLAAKSLDNIKKRFEEATEAEELEIITSGLNSSNSETRNACARMIKELPEGLQDEPLQKITDLVNAAVDTADPAVIEAAGDMMWSMPKGELDFVQKKIYKLIEKSLDNKDHKIQEAYIETIWRIADEDKHPIWDKIFALAKHGLQNTDPKEQLFWARMSAEVPYFMGRAGLEDDIGKIVKMGFDTGQPEDQVFYAGMIIYASDEKYEELVMPGLRNENFEVQNICLKTLGHRMISKDWKRGTQEAVFELVKKGITSENEDSAHNYVRLIRYIADEKEKASLFSYALDRFGAERLVEPPLYKNSDVSEENFKREKFDKTGSGTTLLGGELKSKVIVRHIEAEPFLIWQELYEDHDLWKSSGLDYVPIEPIYSFRPGAKELVDIYTGVLDINFDEWESIGGKFVDDLFKDRDNILKILAEKMISHGHEHDANFCLRFFRDENGKVDISKKPRIYLIDFDMAKKLPQID